MDRRDDRGRGRRVQLPKTRPATCRMGCRDEFDCPRRPTCADEEAWIFETNGPENINVAPSQAEAIRGEHRTIAEGRGSVTIGGGEITIRRCAMGDEDRESPADPTCGFSAAA
jgi:hypothetical protein